jgi:3-hydroxyacyl-[acyl-carrier-protein] dehydratase
MLLNDFYKITDIQNGDKTLVNIELNPNHKIYKGHFPNNPVVPGVCMTQMVKEIVEQITNKKLTMVTGDNLKFTAVLNPEITRLVTLTLTLKNKEEGLLHADAVISAGTTNFFSFKGSFRGV